MAEEHVRPGLTVELVGTPEELREVCRAWTRQLKSMDPDVLKAASKVVRR